MKFNTCIAHNTSYMYHCMDQDHVWQIVWPDLVLIETLINVHAYFYNVTEFSFIENISHEKRDICPHNGKILAYTFFVIPIHLVVKLDDLVHLPRWVTMHILRAPLEWYNIVYLSPLIKNQDVNTQYFGYHRLFWMVFKMATKAKDKMSTWCNIRLLPSVMLTFMSRPSIFKDPQLFFWYQKLNIRL